MNDAFRQAALTRTGAKIPIIYGADEIHGIATVGGSVVFPHNIGLGATNDVALVTESRRSRRRRRWAPASILSSGRWPPSPSTSGGAEPTRRSAKRDRKSTRLNSS